MNLTNPLEMEIHSIYSLRNDFFPSPSSLLIQQLIIVLVPPFSTFSSIPEDAYNQLPQSMIRDGR